MEYLNYIYAKLFGEANDNDVDAYSVPRKIVAFGNVLIDRTVHLENTELLERFGIKHGTKGELDPMTLSEITMAATANTEYIANPGGSALNTVRILKTLGTDALFCGAVGSDKHAEELRDILKEKGITARLQSIDGAQTGMCISLVYEDKPTLYANIGASALYSVEHVKEATRNPEQTILRPIERKQIIYIEGFFVPGREAVCDYIVTHFIRERRRFAFNLSASYIIEQNYAQILKMAHSAFFIFGNSFEFETLRKQMKCATVEEMALKLLQNGNVTKIIVITKAADGAQVISNFVDEYLQTSEVSFQSYNCPRVEDVVDATGAGDAFVAGFLHAWLEKRSLSECIRVATDVAAKVVTQIGCNLP